MFVCLLFVYIYLSWDCWWLFSCYLFLVSVWPVSKICVLQGPTIPSQANGSTRIPPCTLIGRFKSCKSVEQSMRDFYPSRLGQGQWPHATGSSFRKWDLLSFLLQNKEDEIPQGPWEQAPVYLKNSLLPADWDHVSHGTPYWLLPLLQSKVPVEEQTQSSLQTSLHHHGPQCWTYTDVPPHYNTKNHTQGRRFNMSIKHAMHEEAWSLSAQVLINPRL